MLGCGVRRQSGKHRLNLGSAAPRAFVIWRRSSRQVAAVVHCSPCTSSRPQTEFRFNSIYASSVGFRRNNTLLALTLLSGMFCLFETIT
ncbi:hypothetical protein KUCAC02_027279 [Chaenocephalus aceratus]|uniref:Uncharacterized protein n=1 Tax=Chaenocephalus aceratus TaxID=36190 RepID=A0ACB9W3B0_CHAAC|nr:hypothetical protein KUCAC02_027279 [Chaenocephalus aceratus]